VPRELSLRRVAGDNPANRGVPREAKTLEAAMLGVLIG